MAAASAPIPERVHLPRVAAPSDHLKKWWEQHPRLDDPEPWNQEACRSIDDPNRTVNPEALETHPRTLWDRYVSLPLQAKLATPSILLGTLLTLIGIAGCVTALSGWHIKGLEFVMQHVSISIAFSLTLIRAGIHMVNNGVMSSRVKNRWRQETKICYKLCRIADNMRPDPREEARKKEFSEIARQNFRFDPEMRLDRMLPKKAIQGKDVDDLPSGRKQAYGARLACEQLFKDAHLQTELPPLPVPKIQEKELNLQGIEAIYLDPDTPLEEHRSTYWNKWYNFWYNRVTGEKTTLPGLGMIDIVVGQIMLLTALTAFLFMAKPSLVPSPLKILATDPYLTITFGFILIGHWISCTQTGFRMLDLAHREKKRAAIEDDLQLIDYGIEKQRTLEMFAHFEARAQDQQVKDVLALLKQKYLDALPNIEERLQAAEVRWKATDKESGYMKRLGKFVTPHLATPSILIGIVIAFFGLTCVGMSLAGKTPDIFKFLTPKGTEVSILFSAGLVIAGIDAIYKGASLKERETKDVWKADNKKSRQYILNKLFPDNFPTVEPPKASGNKIVSVHGSIIDVPDDPFEEDIDKEHVQEKIKKAAHTVSKGWYGFWVKNFQAMAVPDLFLGTFLLACSLTGILWCCGIGVPSSMDFIVKDPSFSAVFCFSLLGVALDSLNTFWRMGTYERRKIEDLRNKQMLAQCWNKLIPQANPSLRV